MPWAVLEDEIRQSQLTRGAAQFSCDIFCNIIDNYGDIGVSWRLARQLVNEYGLFVRLWVDNLHGLAKLCHEVDASQEIQYCRSVEIRHWAKIPPQIQPAELVIEAFACKLPPEYIEAMAMQQHSFWINLEYLSAESWVEGCHKLPSPHPNLPLTRYFFFPGFTRQTGGLLLERDLFRRRDAFQSDAMQQQAFWQGLGMEAPLPDTLKISLFGYENASLAELFDVWVNSQQPVLCLVPEGRILPQVREYFAGRDLSRHGEIVGINPCLQNYFRGNLTVQVLPFVEQESYDELLWACDVNFVRGEDSFVRAQWAARPFVWQIYPQHDAVHRDKLQAFLNLYNTNLHDTSLGITASLAMHNLWLAWNGVETACTDPSTANGNKGFVEAHWHDFHAAQSELRQYAYCWAEKLAENNLASNLLDLFAKIGRIHAFKIDGQ